MNLWTFRGKGPKRSRPHPSTARRRLPAVEALESRELPAGNVTAAMLGNVLRLTGDGLSNAIRVTQTPAGAYQITGDSDALGNPTTVNGMASVELPASRHLTIDLRGGNDIADLSATDIEGDLRLFAGRGADRITLDHTNARSARTSMGEGQDALTIQDCLFSSLAADLGPSHDTLTVGGAQVSNRFRLDGGEGLDTLWDLGRNSRQAGLLRFEILRDQITREFSLLTASGHPAVFDNRVQRDFLTGYNVARDANGEVKLEPVITSVQDGFTLNCLPILLEDGSIQVELEVEATTIDEPVHKVSVPTPLGRRLVDRPIVRTFQLHTTIQVADQSTALLGLDGSPIDAPLTDGTVPTTALSITPRTTSVGSDAVIQLHVSFTQLLAKTAPRLR